MPDPKTLAVGDRIRIVAVPKGDREAAAAGLEYARETVEILEWMVGREYEIWMVDEYGHAWVILPRRRALDCDHRPRFVDAYGDGFGGAVHRIAASRSDRPPVRPSTRRSRLPRP